MNSKTTVFPKDLLKKAKDAGVSKEDVAPLFKEWKAGSLKTEDFVRKINILIAAAKPDATEASKESTKRTAKPEPEGSSSKVTPIGVARRSKPEPAPKPDEPKAEEPKAEAKEPAPKPESVAPPETAPQPGPEQQKLLGKVQEMLDAAVEAITTGVVTGVVTPLAEQLASVEGKIDASGSSAASGSAPAGIDPRQLADMEERLKQGADANTEAVITGIVTPLAEQLTALSEKVGGQSVDADALAEAVRGKLGPQLTDMEERLKQGADANTEAVITGIVIPLAEQLTTAQQAVEAKLDSRPSAEDVAGAVEAKMGPQLTGVEERLTQGAQANTEAVITGIVTPLAEQLTAAQQAVGAVQEKLDGQSTLVAEAVGEQLADITDKASLLSQLRTGVADDLETSLRNFGTEHVTPLKSSVQELGEKVDSRPSAEDVAGAVEAKMGPQLTGVEERLTQGAQANTEAVITGIVTPLAEQLTTAQQAVEAKLDSRPSAEDVAGAVEAKMGPQLTGVEERLTQGAQANTETVVTSILAPVAEQLTNVQHELGEQLDSRPSAEDVAGAVEAKIGEQLTGMEERLTQGAQASTEAVITGVVTPVTEQLSNVQQEVGAVNAAKPDDLRTGVLDPLQESIRGLGEKLDSRPSAEDVAGAVEAKMGPQLTGVEERLTQGAQANTEAVITGIVTPLAEQLTTVQQGVDGVDKKLEARPSEEAIVNAVSAQVSVLLESVRILVESHQRTLEPLNEELTKVLAEAAVEVRRPALVNALLAENYSADAVKTELIDPVPTLMGGLVEQFAGFDKLPEEHTSEDSVNAHTADALLRHPLGALVMEAHLVSEDGVRDVQQKERLAQLCGDVNMVIDRANELRR